MVAGSTTVTVRSAWKELVNVNPRPHFLTPSRARFDLGRTYPGRCFPSWLQSAPALPAEEVVEVQEENQWHSTAVKSVVKGNRRNYAFDKPFPGFRL